MNMKKIVLLTGVLIVAATALFAQEEEAEKKGFKKENLFTGGGISFGLGFSSGGNTFSIGASPVFGYNITNWLDAGVVANYNYLSFRDVDYYGYGTNDKIKQSVYGGGAFVKIYPISFLFIQAQAEHNFNAQKVIPGNGTNSYKYNFETNSILVGGGYAGRIASEKSPFFYISLLFDVSGVAYTPYTNGMGHALPILRGGVQIPLFQGKRDNYNNTEYDGGGRKPRNYNR